jgi:hypothetical protein
MSFVERQSPEATVYAYIQDPVYGSQQRKLVEILGFNSVSATISMSGPGSANITIPNYKSSLIRYVSYDSIKELETEGRGKETTDRNISNRIASTTTLFPSVWRDTLVDTVDPKSSGNAAKNTIKSSRSFGNVVRDTNSIDIIKDKYIMHSVPVFNTMDPIFIDFKGQDGFWYAGFTGLISRVVDDYTKTGNQSITLVCGDPTMLFDNISLVSGWNRLAVSEQQTNLSDFIYSTEFNVQASKHAAFKTIFQKYDSVVDIILAVVDTAQNLWRLDDQFGENIGVTAFKYDTSKVYEYNGISARRGSAQEVSDIENMNPEFFKDAYKLKEKHYIYTGEKLYSRTPFEGKKYIFVDPLIKEFDNIFIHKLLSNSLSLYKDSLQSTDAVLNDLAAKMLCYKHFDANGNLIFELPRYNAFPNLFDYGGRSTASVIRHQAPKTGRPPKREPRKTTVSEGETEKSVATRSNTTVTNLRNLNNYPNGSAYVRRQRPDGSYITSLKEGAEVIVGTTITKKYKKEKAKFLSVQPKETIHLTGSEDTAIVIPILGEDGYITVDQKELDEYSWYTLNFHGKNYMISHDDFISFNTSQDESKVFTVAATDTTYPYMEKVSDNLRFSTHSLYGVAVANYDSLAKYGVRRFQTQTLYNVIWPTPSHIIGSRVLSYQAKAILDRMNAQVDSGSIQVKHRPELQVGRTFINQLRMKSYLIMSTTNSWSPGGEHSTTLNVSYGHPVYKALEMPWTAIFSEPDVFGFKNGLASFTTIKNVRENGELKPDEELKDVE